MASTRQSHHQPPPPAIVTYETSAATNTTFVHAHPSNFRAVVQHLTGSSTSHGGAPPEHHRRTTTAPPLHERREKAAAPAMMSMRKLEMIKLNNNYNYGNNNNNNGLGLVSPVSTLDGLLSPNTPTDLMREKEERAIIADKGFYLHPSVSPLNNNADPPKLLPLFPLHSPTSHHHH